MSNKKNKDSNILDEVEVNLNLYGNYNLVIVIAKDISKARKKFNKRLGFECNDMSEDVDGLHSYNNNKMEAIIFLTDKSSSGVIAHESFHATLRIMKMIGSKLNKGSEEPYAYLLTYIVDTISEMYINLNKK